MNRIPCCRAAAANGKVAFQPEACATAAGCISVRYRGGLARTDANQRAVIKTATVEVAIATRAMRGPGWRKRRTDVHAPRPATECARRHVRDRIYYADRPRRLRVSIEKLRRYYRLFINHVYGVSVSRIDVGSTLQS